MRETDSSNLQKEIKARHLDQGDRETQRESRERDTNSNKEADRDSNSNKETDGYSSSNSNKETEGDGRRSSSIETASEIKRRQKETEPYSKAGHLLNTTKTLMEEGGFT